MTYRGRIRNGVVVLEGEPALPEGAVVRVEVEPASEGQDLWQGLMQFKGTVPDLPRHGPQSRPLPPRHTQEMTLA